MRKSILVLLLLLVAACGPSRCPIAWTAPPARVTFKGSAIPSPALQALAIAEIDSWGTPEAYAYTVEPFPCAIPHGITPNDFPGLGRVTTATSWTDVRTRTIHLSWRAAPGGGIDVEDIRWEVFKLLTALGLPAVNPYEAQR